MFEVIKGVCIKEFVDMVKGIFEFYLEGKELGVWYLDFENDLGKKYCKWDFNCMRFFGLIFLLFGKFVCRQCVKFYRQFSFKDVFFVIGSFLF